MPDFAPLSCVIYKSPRRLETYLYVREAEGLDPVPEALLREFGRSERVMALTLHPQRKLARVPVTEVIHALLERGYFLQMPPSDPLAPYRIQEAARRRDPA